MADILAPLNDQKSREEERASKSVQKERRGLKPKLK
jgi:hypothetical protein